MWVPLRAELSVNSVIWYRGQLWYGGILLQVWLTILLSVVICFLSLRNKARTIGLQISVSSTMLILWGTFLQRGSLRIFFIHPRYLSRKKPLIARDIQNRFHLVLVLSSHQCFRIPLLLWGHLGFMLSQWYLASLQSFLTCPSRIPVITTLRELDMALSHQNPARICLQRESLAQYVVEARCRENSMVDFYLFVNSHSRDAPNFQGLHPRPDWLTDWFLRYRRAIPLWPSVCNGLWAKTLGRSLH